MRLVCEQGTTTTIKKRNQTNTQQLIEMKNIEMKKNKRNITRKKHIIQMCAYHFIVTLKTLYEHILI